jgi:HemY protein
MMAEIEEAEHNDIGRARDWLSRAVRAPRDPTWTADGYVFDHWEPVSPISGRIDAFEWKVPADRLPAIDEAAETLPAMRDISPPPSGEPTGERAAEEPTGPAPEPADPTEPTYVPQSAEPPPEKKDGAGQQTAIAVIGPSRQPDDPGPEPADEPQPDKTEPSRGKRFRLFPQ